MGFGMSVSLQTDWLSCQSTLPDAEGEGLPLSPANIVAVCFVLHQLWVPLRDSCSQIYPLVRLEHSSALGSKERGEGVGKGPWGSTQGGER